MDKIGFARPKLFFRIFPRKIGIFLEFLDFNRGCRSFLGQIPKNRKNGLTFAEVGLFAPDRIFLKIEVIARRLAF